MTSTVPFVSNGVANGNGNKLLNPQVSARIRERLIESGVSFLANDNIADHLQPGELDQLQVEVADKVRDLLRSLVIDIDNDHNTHETAERVAKMYLQEVFKGRYHQQPKVASFPNVKQLDGSTPLARSRFVPPVHTTWCRSWATAGSGSNLVPG